MISLKIKHVYLRGRMMRLEIGDGIDFWHDVWCGATSLKDRFTDLFRICFDQECIVSIMNEKNWRVSFMRWLSEDLQDQLMNLCDMLFRCKAHGSKDVAICNEDISTVHASSCPKDTNQGPHTRSCAKKLQEQVNSFLTDCNFNTSENVMLPKCPILMMLKFTHEDMEDTWPKDQDTVLQNCSIGKVTRTDYRTQKK
jgi:hypothetical protein